jgi:hypothetical protein
MSALGQKQTFALQNLMSALAPTADICSATAHVCFGPIADNSHFQLSAERLAMMLTTLNVITTSLA